MIRKIETHHEDINAIMDIWLEATVKAHPFLSKEYWEENYDVVKTEYLPHSDTYVYSKNNKILGFISVIEDTFIGALFVRTDNQRSGIGKELIRFVMEKYETLSLAVYVENESAVSFYKRMGFDIIQEQLNEDSKAPEYIMEIKS